MTSETAVVFFLHSSPSLIWTSLKSQSRGLGYSDHFLTSRGGGSVIRSVSLCKQGKICFFYEAKKWLGYLDTAREESAAWLFLGGYYPPGYALVCNERFFLRSLFFFSTRFYIWFFRGFKYSQRYHDFPSNLSNWVNTDICLIFCFWSKLS